MADLSITDTEVTLSSAGKVSSATANTTITAGDLLYLDGGNKLALASTAVNTDAIVGIAVNGASSGQPCSYCTQDTALDLGASVTPAISNGTIYLNSDTAGAISNTHADHGAGDYTAIVGIGVGAQTIKVNFQQASFFRAGVAQ